MPTSSQISTLDRERTLGSLESQRFDLVVIGGGITGAGLAREATLRGLSVALLEACDFAAGTSSRSSKLIHGGLRYLAMGDVALVRETALERKVIFRLAPHLAERRWMVLPVRSRATLLKFRAGITTYEKLGAVEREDLHQNWSSEDLAREEPLIDRTRYPHACAYREYLTDDARLVLANLRAAAAGGARISSYTTVDGIVRAASGRAAGVRASCGLSGRRVRVEADCVVNAAGPWVESVLRLEQPEAPPLLHLSKGVHIVLPAERVPLRNILLLNTGDGRSIFAIRQGEVVYLGTTDTTWEHGPRVWPDVSIEDVEYLLEPLGRYFTIDPPTPDEVSAAWSGLRPLVAQPGKKPTDISRKDEVLVSPAGVITIAGGKLTGYRPTVERVLQKVSGVLERPLPAVDGGPLPGGDFDGNLERLAHELATELAVGEIIAARLARLYGSEARDVAALGSKPLVDGASVIAGEVDWSVLREGAARVEDVIYRRTRAALYVPKAGQRIVEPVARRMAELLGWNPQQQSEEVEHTRKRLAADLSFSGRGS